MANFLPTLPGPELKLLLDRRLAAHASNVTCRLAPFRKHHDNPLLLDGGRVWRQDNLAGLIRYLPDEGVLWGNITTGLSDRDEPRPHPAVQSRDGIEWRTCPAHRDLHRVAHDPDGEFPFKGVIKICEATDEQNKEYWHLNFGGRILTSGEPGIGVARSADARQWQIIHPILRQTATLHKPGTDLWGGGDGYNHLVYLPERRQYACYVRTNIDRQPYGGRKERCVSLLLSDDFVTWSPQQVVLRPWTDVHAACGDGKYDFYHMPVFRYGQVYLSVISVFHWEPDTVHLELVWSPDGVHWDRVCPQQEFITQGEGREAIDSGCNFACQEPLLRGDEMWWYYGGSAGRHNTNPERTSGLCLARFGRDRFAGLEPDRWDRPANWTSRPFAASAGQLRLNVAADNGHVRVSILDEHEQPIAGFGLDDSLPLTGDGVRLAATWRGGDRLDALAGRPIRLQLQWERASLYAFTIEP
jgi:hypothetical protein